MESGPLRSEVPENRWRSRIPPGKLAYPVEIDSLLALRPGDRLDLFATGETPQAGFSLMGALVIDGSRREPVLALSPEEIQWVELVRQKGKLKAAVRNATDGLPPRQRPARGKRPKRAKSGAIQIWEGE